MRHSKRIERREEIEKVAIELLIEEGYQSSSMLKIAKSAQCSNETLYRWYSSKPKLLATLVEKNCAALEDEIRALYESLDELSALERMGELILKRTLAPDTIALMRAVQAERYAKSTVKDEVKYADLFISESAKTYLESQALASLFRGGSLGKEKEEVVNTFLSLLLGDLPVRCMLGSDLSLSMKERKSRSRDAMEKTRRIFTRLSEKPCRSGRG